MCDVIYWFLMTSFYAKMSSKFGLIFEELLVILKCPAFSDYFFVVRVVLRGFNFALIHFFF